jgi:hypothetical protein
VNRKGSGSTLPWPNLYSILGIFLFGLRKRQETSFAIFGVPAKIRKGHLQNASAGATAWDSLFGYISNRKCKFVSGPLQRDGHSRWYKWSQLPKVNKMCGVHVAAGQSIAQSRSRKTGNSHELRIQLRNSSAEPVCIIGESSPLHFYRDVQTLQISLHLKRCQKQIRKNKT